MNNLSNNQTNYNYYVYSSTIVRVNNVTEHVEIKQHDTNQWKEIQDPKILQRVQIDGDQVTKEEAEEMYRIFHETLKKKAD